MRLKTADGPLQAIHNRNNDILNSPKRINTVQNSNYQQITTSNLLDNVTATANETSTITNNLEPSSLTIEEAAVLSGNVRNATEELRWYNSDLRHRDDNFQRQRTLSNNRSNINSTLAAQFRMRAQHALKRDPLTPLSSPDNCDDDDDDDVPITDDDACCSSASVSPREEERAFEPSDSSDEGNDYSLPTVADVRTAPLKGFVNPNYPGFQHLAHTLNFDEDTLNNANNNNNNDEYEEVDKIDSVNRLDSIDNIQKVFHEKSLDLTTLGDSPNDTSSANGDFSSEGSAGHDVARSVASSGESFNIQKDETKTSVIGDFEQEMKDELDKVVHSPEEPPEKFRITDDDTVPLSNADLPPPPPSFTELQQKKQETLAKLARHSRSHPESSDPKVKGTTWNVASKPNRPVPTFLPLNEPTAVSDCPDVLSPIENKLVDASLSGCHEQIAVEKTAVDDVVTSRNRRDSNKELEQIEIQIRKIKSDTITNMELRRKLEKEESPKQFREQDDVPQKASRRRRDYNQQFGSLITFPKRETTKREPLNRRSVPSVRDKKKTSNYEPLGVFDVYNIETAMPKIDLEAIECHLKAAREEERRRRTDREEIRRRLAMGNEDDYYTDRPGRKPSLQARLQSGMNLQICFMNETVSDNESSPSSDSECPLTNPKPAKTSRQNQNPNGPAQRPATLALHPAPSPVQLGTAAADADFFTKQARLQTEARMALAQAKEMARMQMEVERQRQKKSPITEMVRHSLEKVGIPFPEEKRRLSRQILTDMNVAQLQVIVNDLHTQIETLNEQLVKFLMERDDLHMEQDSMLVDIEDLTRYLGAKEQVIKEQQLAPTPQNNNLLPPPSPAPSSPLTTLNNTVRPHLNRIANLVKK